MQSIKEQYQEELSKRQEATNAISKLFEKMGRKKDVLHPLYPQMHKAIWAYKRADGRIKRLEKWYKEEL